ncbi:MAG: DNA mismatch repair ATPase msh1 [Trizodia sp. TS-e1964]|nr:MAG: DNA mismatch repair ATPase msh1 [Trizodia sp. TS-e1964]
MEKFDHCVLLTRVGGFYELYFHQAEEYGPLLSLKVGRKRAGAGTVPMSGFPVYQLERFLKILVQDLDKYVAISEEFPNDVSDRSKSGGLLFNRKVSRIISPGTLIDEKFLDPYENNFLLAVFIEDSVAPVSFRPKGDGIQQSQAVGASEFRDTKDVAVGLSWLDLSTGDFFTQPTYLSLLPSSIERISPREIIFDKDKHNIQANLLKTMLSEERYLTTHHPSPSEPTPASTWESMLETPELNFPESQFTSQELWAGSYLLSYVRIQLQGLELKLQAPVRRLAMENMGIDKSSMRALEIKTTLRENKSKGSLLHAIRRTVTKSGARLLASWLTSDFLLGSPSTSIPIINGRLDLVTHFLGESALRENIVVLLGKTYDSQRLVQKFSMGRGDPDDLIALSRTIMRTKMIAEILQKFQGLSEKSDAESFGPKCITSILEQLVLEGPVELAGQITDAIDEEGVMHKQQLEDARVGELVAISQKTVSVDDPKGDLSAVSKVSLPKSRAKAKEANEIITGDDEDVWIMKRSASTALCHLHESLETLKGDKVDLEARLRHELGAKSLTLRWTPGLGHIIHVKGRDSASSFDAKVLGSSKSTRSLHVPEWSRLGNRIDQAKLRIRGEEQRIFQSLRLTVIYNLSRLRQNAAILDELDITTSFAELAKEQQLVRPILNTGTTHKIIGGRHPMVEDGLRERGRSFITNDCFLTKDKRIWLVTGPNMAGKSTFLRQNALISILAQIGSFVPAEHAEIGIVDQIFTRVGSADELYRDQSTFMVEMLETAAILNQATEKSFVIMDEVGRGTTPEDGIAVSYACLHHLYHSTRCRTLFATHFHTLADMTHEWSGLERYCTDVAEDAKGAFSYIHRLRNGVNRNSHALKVARLAGKPHNSRFQERLVTDFGERASQAYRTA